MKLFALSLLMACNVYAALNEKQANQLADAIYVVEGGSKTKHPYGIKSVKTKDPRAVCIKTIQNNHNRWLKANKPGKFLDFLANRYCPVAGKNLTISEKKCNKNWLPNLKKVLGEDSYEDFQKM